ncbi:MAG: hypothetical protein KF893_07575 [Caldilineaceae bacterium]|nr:hypothetical protein [Caldilineaceae bacterium]
MPGTRSILVTIILSIALLAGCGDSEPEEPTPTFTPIIATSVPTHTPRPTATTFLTRTPTPEPTIEAEVAPDAEAVTPPAESAVYARVFNLPNDVLESFRSRGQLSLITIFENDTHEEEMLNLEAAFIRAENEFGFNQFFQLGVVRADQNAPQTVAIYESGNAVAALFEGTWRTAQRSNAILSMADNPFVPPLVEFTTGLSEAEELGIETINNREAIHYQSRDPQIFLRVAGLEMTEGQEIESAQMDVWVATDGNYILLYRLTATINDAVDFNDTREPVRVDQNIAWEFEVYAINSEISIDLPEDAPEPGASIVPGFAEGEFPLPNGAEMRINIFGQTEITTDLSEDEVVNFYQQKLVELGWKIEGNFGIYEATKDELQFSLAMIKDDQGGTRIQIRD